jgi:hypothetical protein
VEVELIIWPRGAASGKTQRADSAGRDGQRAFSARGGDSDGRGGFCVIPCAGGGEPESLWIGGRSPDVCGVAEKWEDAIHLRPACAGELRECAVPAHRNAALLVFATASGAADEYLACTPGVIATGAVLQRGRDLALMTLPGDPSLRLTPAPFRMTPSIRCKHRSCCDRLECCGYYESV